MHESGLTRNLLNLAQAAASAHSADCDVYHEIIVVATDCVSELYPLEAGRDSKHEDYTSRYTTRSVTTRKEHELEPINSTRAVLYVDKKESP